MRDAKGVGALLPLPEAGEHPHVGSLCRQPSGLLLRVRGERQHTLLWRCAARALFSDEYPIVNLLLTSAEGQIDTVFLRKYKGWKYEQEWRIIIIRLAGLRSYPPSLLKGVILVCGWRKRIRQRLKGGLVAGAMKFNFIRRDSTVWLTLEQIQLVAILLLFGAGLLLRKSL